MPERVFSAPAVPYAVISAALFASADPPDVLLTKLERTALESPVVLALVSDEDPSLVTLLKNPRRFVGSLIRPTPLDGLVFGFSGPDARRLAAVHVPASAFETSAAYNVLDDAGAVRAGLEALPADHAFHPYVNVGTAGMTNSACKRAVLLPTDWHSRLAREFPFGVGLKELYDLFLAPLSAAEAPLYRDVFDWWRHAATRAAAAGARPRSGLQVDTAQALPPAIRGDRDGWAQEQVEALFRPLRAVTPPLSSAAFETGMHLLRTDLAAHHAVREARELAQHADREAREDRRDAPQTFEGRFGTAKLEEVLRLLALDTADDLPELLRTLGRNKKKSDDALVLQMAIDNRAAAPASAANEYTKPTLSTHIIDLFRSYSWAATGELVTDGITPFNITFASEASARAVALRVTKLVAVESGSSAMSYSDAETFLVDESTFPADTTACGYRLQAHSILVDLMLGELAPFAVAYRQCVSDLRSHFELSLKVHYGELGGGAYHIALRILYWITQQFLYYLSERKFGRDPPVPDFSGLLRHVHTKTLDGFLGRLPASWLERVHPESSTPGPSGAAPPGGQATPTARTRGTPEAVTNTNYVNSLKKRWQASGLNTLQAMLQAHTGEGAPLVPKMGEQEACLSWLIKGRCFANCPRAATHKQANQALIAQVHALMDACGLPASN
jgi:hypothetical protein